MLYALNPFTGHLDCASPDVALLTGTPTGFLDPANVVVSYDSSTQKITLTGTTTAYYNGRLVSILVPGWQSTAHTNTTGHIYYLYYDGTNFAWATDTFPGFDKLLIATVTYRSVNKFCLRECHGFMDWRDHEEFHRSIGTYRKSGGTVTGLTIGSTTAAQRRPDVSACTIADEDLDTVNAPLTSKSYSQRYLAGSNTITYSLAQSDIIPLSGANPYYNSFSTPNWGQTLMPANSLASVWVYEVPVSSDAGSQAIRHVFVQPQWITQSQGPSANQLQDALKVELLRSSSELNLGDPSLLASEYVAIERIVVVYTSGDWYILSQTSLGGNRFSQISSPTGDFLQTVAVTSPITGNGTLSSPLALTKAAAVANATSTSDIVTQFNALLTSLRNGGYLTP